MVVTDNLAAHALGEFFCNFSFVNWFCNCAINNMIEKVDIYKFILRTQKEYNNNIVNIEADPESCSL